MKDLFVTWHRVCFFPNVLLSFSIVWFLNVFLGIFNEDAIFGYMLGFYAFSVTVIWIAQISHKVRTSKLDGHPLLNK